MKEPKDFQPGSKLKEDLAHLNFYLHIVESRLLVLNDLLKFTGQKDGKDETRKIPITVTVSDSAYFKC